MVAVRDSHPTIAVITATIGHRFLARAVDSVSAQTHPAITHWIVVDGPQSSKVVSEDLRACASPAVRRRVLVLSERTGHSGWCSHRIAAAMPFLVDAEYVCYLDQDNWFSSDHVSSLLETARATNQPCAYALRNIYDRDGRFVCRDDCQSLGTLHDCYDLPGARHIDSNCWLLRRDVAMAMAAHWATPYTGDRKVAMEVMKAWPDLPCTKRYSVNYSAASRAESAPESYFLRGNAWMARKYPRGLPWHEPETCGAARGRSGATELSVTAERLVTAERADARERVARRSVR
jgi:glycosyltransferase involved in cell wall biosynthesis